MRLRIIALVVAVSSMILVSFLVPLALVLRTLAADRALSTATVKAQWMAPLVTTLDTSSLKVAVAQVNAESGNGPVTVFLPDGTAVGPAAPRSAAVRLAERGRSFTTNAPGGAEVLVSVQGLPRGTAVIQAFVPAAQLHRGVAKVWLLLGAVGMGLLMLSVVVADQLARSLVRPLSALARASDLLATGDLSARARLTGPIEVRQAGSGLNRLAVRIGELLAHERETVADLSHRLRTPLTALRIDAESLRDRTEMSQIIADAEAVERTVNEIIREARRPGGDAVRVSCEAGQVITERSAFWRPLAEDQDRRMTVEITPADVPVGVSDENLAACTDILLENVFSHTPEGVSFAIRLSPRAGGGGWLVVADNGPGFQHADPARRGTSSGGSTGLGLDIARRIAESSGGSLTLGRSATGGGAVTVGLGPPAGYADSGRRHRRARPHLGWGRRGAPEDGWPEDPPPWAGTGRADPGGWNPRGAALPGRGVPEPRPPVPGYPQPGYPQPGYPYSPPPLGPPVPGYPPSGQAPSGPPRPGDWMPGPGSPGPADTGLHGTTSPAGDWPGYGPVR